MRIDIARLQPAGVTERLATRMIADLRSFWDDNGGLDASKVEIVDCSLCATPCPADTYFSKERFPYRRCPGCGLVYPSPRPRSRYIQEQYVSGRFSSTFRDLYLPSAPYRMATIFKERVEEIILPRVLSGCILDVGCGSGHFLKVAESYGYSVHGVELNPEMAQHAVTELKLPNVRCGTLFEANYPCAYFDVVTLWDVLEHLEQPSQFLKTIGEVLKPGGWIFAYTENFESFNVFIAKEYSEMIAPDVHLRHYSPQTFHKEFEQAGFHVEEVYTRGLDISHIRKTYGTNAKAFHDGQLALSSEHEEIFQDFINRLGKGDNLRLYARKI